MPRLTAPGPLWQSGVCTGPSTLFFQRVALVVAYDQRPHCARNLEMKHCCSVWWTSMPMYWSEILSRISRTAENVGGHSILKTSVVSTQECIAPREVIDVFQVNVTSRTVSKIISHSKCLALFSFDWSDLIQAERCFLFCFLKCVLVVKFLVLPLRICVLWGKRLTFLALSFPYLVKEVGECFVVLISGVLTMYQALCWVLFSFANSSMSQVPSWSSLDKWGAGGIERASHSPEVRWIMKVKLELKAAGWALGPPSQLQT